jgi:hypothetical protein
MSSTAKIEFGPVEYAILGNGALLVLLLFILAYTVSTVGLFEDLIRVLRGMCREVIYLL